MQINLSSLIYYELLRPSYYPFGMLMPGRKFYPKNYQFGFNTQMRDDDLKGRGNLSTAMYWEYDTRIGRRLNIDPKSKFGLSSYAVMSNNPIFETDVFGDTTLYYSERGRFLGQTNDGLANQVHFINKNLYLSARKAASHGKMSDDKLATLLRSVSYSWAGKNLAGELETIFKKSVNEELERGGVFVINPLTRELHAVDLSDKMSDRKPAQLKSLGVAIDNCNLNVVGFFHTHWQNVWYAYKPTEPMFSDSQLGKVDYNDFSPYISHKTYWGGTPALIISKDNFTIYSTVLIRDMVYDYIPEVLKRDENKDLFNGKLGEGVLRKSMFKK